MWAEPDLERVKVLLKKAELENEESENILKELDIINRKLKQNGRQRKIGEFFKPGGPVAIIQSKRLKNAIKDLAKEDTGLNELRRKPENDGVGEGDLEEGLESFVYKRLKTE